MIKITKQRKKGELIDDIGEQTTGYSMVAKLVDHIKKTFKNPLVKLTMEKLNITEGEFLEGLLRNFKELSDDRKISFLPVIKQLQGRYNRSYGRPEGCSIGSSIPY